ncbi:hypothetical protein FBU30_005653 [Linnemannia zychae]|nr:hypothetical protein FBU30_005653 [Linnemannia zychae]
MTPLFTFVLLIASVLGVMSAPISSNTSINVAAISPKYFGLGFINTNQFHQGGCNGVKYSSEDAVVAMNADQFGSLKSGSSVCGKYVKINRADSSSIHYLYRVVDVCKDCEKNSLLFSKKAMREFTNQSRFPIVWEVVENPKEPRTDKSDHDSKPKPNPESKPSSHHSDQIYRGRGTWFSDTYGSCGVKFSQDDMIVALNEAQQGMQYGPNSKCFKKIRVSIKGEPSKSVVVRVVDTCPHRYCSYGQLDLSQAAFRYFAPMSKGILDLEWSFVDF